MINKVDNIFSALADSSRREILVMLSKGSKSAGSIAGEFKISRPAVSKHLRILKDSGLVETNKQGRERYFSINPAPIKEVFNWLKFYDKFWDEKLHLLKTYIESNK